jgi:hypothetical protein
MRNTTIQLPEIIANVYYQKKINLTTVTTEKEILSCRTKEHTASEIADDIISNILSKYRKYFAKNFLRILFLHFRNPFKSNFILNLTCSGKMILDDETEISLPETNIELFTHRFNYVQCSVMIEDFYKTYGFTKRTVIPIQNAILNDAVPIYQAAISECNFNIMIFSLKFTGKIVL